MSRKFLISIAALTLFAVTGCSDDDNPVAPGTQAPDFSGDYVMDNWTKTGIAGGTTTISPSTGAADSPTFSYAVNLGNPGGGVSHRTATFSVPAGKSGTAIIEWRYTGFHAFFFAFANLSFFAETSGGTTTITEVDNVDVFGNFSFTGRTTMAVEEGMPFGFTAGGSNFDSDSRLNGTVTLTDFRVVRVQ